MSIITSYLFGLTMLLSGCTGNTDEVKNEIEKEEIDNTCPSGKLFIEKDGIVRVDLENETNSTNGWSTSISLSGYIGSGYLIWTGNDNFNTPGVGLMKYSIKINTPGTYQFVWKSRIGQGTSISDFNDSWLRISTANDFYGKKTTGEIVYPKGSGKTPVPEGAGSNGWFKVYMNNVGEWFWRSSTSDNDPHNIFARFDTVGTYDVEISGRSKFHAIDQFVLFITNKNLSDATSASLSEITCK